MYNNVHNVNNQSAMSHPLVLRRLALAVISRTIWSMRRASSTVKLAWRFP